MDSLATKDDINQFRAEIQRVIDSLRNKVDKMESRVFDEEAENDELKTEIRKIQENNKDLKNRIDQYDKEKRQLRRNQNDHEQYLRRWNCRVYKVPEEEGETANNCIKKCAKVFTKDIGVMVTETDIEHHRAVPLQAGQGPGGVKPQKPQEQGGGSWGGSDQSQLQSAAGRRKTLGHLGSVVVQW